MLNKFTKYYYYYSPLTISHVAYFWFFPALLDLRLAPYYLSTFLLRYGAQVIKIGLVPRGTGTLPSQFCPQCFHYYNPTLVSLSPQYFFMMTKLNWCLYHLFTQKPSFPISYLHNGKKSMESWTLNLLNFIVSESAINPVAKIWPDFFFYWRIVDLQRCVSFCCTAKWVSYTYKYIHSFLKFCSHMGHHRVVSRVPCAIGSY